MASERLELHVRRSRGFPDPEAAFAGLFSHENAAFWLDSSLSSPDLARWSFMGSGAGPWARVLLYDSERCELSIDSRGTSERRRIRILDYLDQELRAGASVAARLPFDFNGGFVGFFGYELKGELGGRHEHESPLPDAAFIFADRFLAFDLERRCLDLVCLAPRGAQAQAEQWFDEIDRRLASLPAWPPPVGAPDRRAVSFGLTTPYPRYLESIARSLEHIRDGESYEVCLTHQIRVAPRLEPFEVYRELRRIHPAPYAAYLRLGDLAVLSSSPESFLRIRPDGRVESKPIKGTLPRGRTPQEDAVLRERLRSSPKDRAENLMIVDLLRNDLGRVCEIGSVNVPQLMDVETYETVHQMVSTIRGRLRPGTTAVDCIRHCFPGGSVTGAPKLRTMQILDRLEPVARGVYSGSIGFLALGGAADLNIAIRTIVVHGESMSVGVGGAIVALSDPEQEFEETLLKARASMHAIVRAARGRDLPDFFERAREGLRTAGSVTF